MPASRQRPAEGRLPTELWLLALQALEPADLLPLRLVSRWLCSLVDSSATATLTTTTTTTTTTTFKAAPLLSLRVLRCDDALPATLRRLLDRSAWAAHVAALARTLPRSCTAPTTRKTAWLIHDVHHNAAVSVCLTLIWMPVKQAAPPSAPETPAQQPPMILVQRLSTNAVVSYPTRSGLALIAEAIGAPMGDCTSVFVSSAPLPSDSAASRMGTGMLPKRYPRRLPTRAVYTTADYGGEPRLRAEMASDTAHFRAVLRLMDPLPASPATSGSSRPALELWFRGGSVQSFLVERYHIVDGDRDGDGDRMTMQSSYRREFTSMFSPASSSPPSALSESDALDGFWHDVASGFGAKMARFCEYWSHMAEYDPSVQDPAGAEQAGRHRPHYNLAGRFQSDQTWQ